MKFINTKTIKKFIVENLMNNNKEMVSVD